MIKGTKTIDGIEISTLPAQSHKRIIKICDMCKQESECNLKDIYRNRLRRKTQEDVCKRCANIERGKKRRKGKYLLLSSGYYVDYNDEGKRVAVHRLIMEKHLNRKLDTMDIVHHINGDKLDNRIENLCLVRGEGEHQLLHRDLENIAMELVREGLIEFNREEKKYYRVVNKTQTPIFPKSLGFEEIAFTQKKNLLKSRLDAGIRSEVFRGVFLDVPLIAANMSTVTNWEFCNRLKTLGAMGVLHRAFSNEKKYAEEVKKLSNSDGWVAASIGVPQLDLAKLLVKNNANILFIDIAHGYSDYVVEFCKKLRKEFPSIKLVVGNTVNTEMMQEVDPYVDAVKVGIAQGFACETKNTAGCTEKQFSAILKFKEISKMLGLPYISDGGIKEPSDFTKSIAAGANSAMAGKIFAACPNSAAEIELINDVPKKVYAGMASRYVQETWRGGLKAGTCPEGGVRYLEVGESVEKLIERYSGALRSGITYAGARDIDSFQENVEFIRI